jgi:sugar phosphate isomerase/epimerase
MVPGKGEIDFNPIFKALKNIEYGGFVSVELGAAYCMEPVAACRESMEFLRLQEINCK